MIWQGKKRSTIKKTKKKRGQRTNKKKNRQVGSFSEITDRFLKTVGNRLNSEEFSFYNIYLD